MLTHPTHDRLLALGLPGMARAFQDQRASPDLAALSFEERVGIMADREAGHRKGGSSSGQRRPDGTLVLTARTGDVVAQRSLDVYDAIGRHLAQGGRA